MFCRKCGTQNDDTATVCVQCGTPLNFESTPDETTGELGHSDGAKTKVNILESVIAFIKQHKRPVIAFVLVFAVAVTGICAASRKSDEEKIMELIEELSVSFYEGDMEKMLDCFEPQAKNQVSSLINAGSSLGGFDSQLFGSLWSLGASGIYNETGGNVVTVYSITIIDENTAKADLKINFGILGEDRSKWDLVKIDGDWYFTIDNL